MVQILYILFLFCCVDRVRTPSRSKGARKSFAVSPPMDFGSQSTNIVETLDNVHDDEEVSDPVPSQVVEKVVSVITDTPSKSSGVGSCPDSGSVTMDEAYSSQVAGQTPAPTADPLALGNGYFLFCFYLFS